MSSARALASAVPRPYWLDQPGAPECAPALVGQGCADLVVIGAGFTGLWTALLVFLLARGVLQAARYPALLRTTFASGVTAIPATAPR